MLVLTIRTDKPEAEIGLYDGHEQIAYETWPAHRELGRSLHVKIAALLNAAGKDWADLQAVAAYRGPGSFTGLRIGLTVANVLASECRIPIAGASGESWIGQATSRLLKDEDDRSVMPEYGAEANITRPK